MRLFEIQMGDKFYYTTGRNGEGAAKKVKKAFGGHFSHAFWTGCVKFRGEADC